jgi:hypothetical protein
MLGPRPADAARLPNQGIERFIKGGAAISEATIAQAADFLKAHADAGSPQHLTLLDLLQELKRRKVTMTTYLASLVSRLSTRTWGSSASTVMTPTLIHTAVTCHPCS